MKKIKTIFVGSLLGFVLLFTLIQPVSSFIADPEYGDIDSAA